MESKKGEPFNIIFSTALYNAIKYNQGLKPDDSYISKEDIEEFEKFKTMFKEFLSKLNKHDQSAFTVLSNIMSLWGYSRKYCGMCGRPVIGRGGYILGRLVCESCHGSYKITEELYNREKDSNKSKKTHIYNNKEEKDVS